MIMIYDVLTYYFIDLRQIRITLQKGHVFFKCFQIFAPRWACLRGLGANLQALIYCFDDQGSCGW